MPTYSTALGNGSMFSITEKQRQCKLCNRRQQRYIVGINVNVGCLRGSTPLLRDFLLNGEWMEIWLSE